MVSPEDLPAVSRLIQQGKLLKEPLNQAMLAQQLLLQRFCDIGLATTIEELAGHTIPDLAFPDSEGNYQVNIMRTGSRIRPEDDPMSTEWGLNPIPTPSEEGIFTFDNTLRVRASRNHDFVKVSGSAWTFMTSEVLVEFSEEGHLKVSGNETTFDGQLIEGDQAILEQARDGIKHAFQQPKTGPSPVVYAHLSVG